MHSCEIGIHYTGASQGLDVIGTYVKSSTDRGVVFSEMDPTTGALKMTHTAIRNSVGNGFELRGATNSVPNESFYTAVTSTVNGYGADAFAGKGNRQWTISSVASADAGVRILVTLSSDHDLSLGTPAIHLSGTGVPGYDDFTTYVYNVPATNQVVLDMNYVSDATGTLSTLGWDWLTESLNASQNVRAQFSIGGNYNRIKLDGGYSHWFVGTRLAQEIWLDNTASQPYGILFVTGIDDGYGGSNTAKTTPATERVLDIPVSGPGSIDGWRKIGQFRRTGAGGYAPSAGSLTTGMMMPYTAGGLNAATRVPNDHNYMFVK